MSADEYSINTEVENLMKLFGDIEPDKECVNYLEGLSKKFVADLGKEAMERSLTRGYLSNLDFMEAISNNPEMEKEVSMYIDIRKKMKKDFRKDYY